MPHSPGSGSARIHSARVCAPVHVFPPPRPPRRYQMCQSPGGGICSGRACGRHACRNPPPGSALLDQAGHAFAECRHRSPVMARAGRAGCGELGPRHPGRSPPNPARDEGRVKARRSSRPSPPRSRRAARPPAPAPAPTRSPPTGRGTARTRPPRRGSARSCCSDAYRQSVVFSSSRTPAQTFLNASTSPATLASASSALVTGTTGAPSRASSLRAFSSAIRSAAFRFACGVSAPCQVHTFCPAAAARRHWPPGARGFGGAPVVVLLQAAQVRRRDRLAVRRHGVRVVHHAAVPAGQRDHLARRSGFRQVRALLPLDREGVAAGHGSLLPGVGGSGHEPHYRCRSDHEQGRR